MKRVYRYSITWRLLFGICPPLIFGLVLFYFINSGLYYHTFFATVVGALSAIPYLFITIKFSEKFIITDEQITQKNFFISRTLRWKNIIEYRDFYNLMVLMPLVVLRSINIYFYCNISKYEEFRAYLVERSRAFEVNMMSRKRDRIFLVIDLGAIPILGILIANIITAIVISNSTRFDLSFMLDGVISGVWFVLSSVSVWILIHDFTQMAKEYRHFIATMMAISFIGPVVIMSPLILKGSNIDFAIFTLTYILGYSMGWGGMSGFFPNRGKKSIRITGNNDGRKG